VCNAIEMLVFLGVMLMFYVMMHLYCGWMHDEQHLLLTLKTSELLMFNVSVNYHANDAIPK